MKQNKALRIANIFLGILSVAFFVYDGILFSSVRPKMENWVPLTSGEEQLLLLMGVGLMVILLFFTLTIYQVIRTIRFSERLPVGLVLLFVIGVVAALFIFSDVALLMDISKQYDAGFLQPEWNLVYPIMIGQLAVALLFLILHISGYFSKQNLREIVQDSNIFLVVQVVGLVCGGMGLVMSMLGFFFPKGWNPLIHTVMGSAVVISPYLLVIAYWIILKLKEPSHQLYDEKQILDVGRSAFLTLIISVVLMVFLFASQYNDLGGVVRYLWMPLYLFGVVFLFSIGNLYFSSRV
jgi:hypothetical protein